MWVVEDSSSLLKVGEMQEIFRTFIIVLFQNMCVVFLLGMWIGVLTMDDFVQSCPHDVWKNW